MSDCFPHRQRLEKRERTEDEILQAKNSSVSLISCGAEHFVVECDHRLLVVRACQKWNLITPPEIKETRED
jgi:hypothetical protein